MPVDDGANFIYYLNESLSENERIFKLKEAVLHNETLTVKLLYPQEKSAILTDALKEKVQRYSRAVVPPVFELKLEFVRTFSDESTVRTALMEYLYSEAVLIYPKVKNCVPKIEFEPFAAKLTLPIPDYAYGFCETSGLKKKAEEHLSKCFIEDFEITFLPYEENVSLERAEREYHRETVKTIAIEYDLDMLHYGSISKFPRYIKDVAGAESDSETICGVVSNYKKIVSKDGQRTFYTFRLNDTTATIDVKYFPYKTAKDRVYNIFDLLKDGDKVAVEGRIQADNFTHANAMFMRYFTICRIDFTSINDKIDYLNVPSEYFKVKPKPYSEEVVEVVDFFHLDEDIPEVLQNKTYVVFDFETTGLNPGTDSPIEIGAVKIENGTITETFSTFIKPQFKDGRTSIGSEITKLTGITDKMLEDAPEQKDVAGDIYRFFYGSVLVAHNADFDMAFLKRLGDDNYYNFDNEYMDTLKLARERTRFSKHNLGFLCEKLGIDLSNAHRAVYDAIATAKLFLKLVKMQLPRAKK